MSGPRERPASPGPAVPPLAAFDANAFDRVTPREGASADGISALVASGRLRLVLLPGVAAELSHPNAPPELRAALRAAEPARLARPSARQDIDRIRVRAIMRGDGRPGKHDVDAAHLSDAAQAGCRFFVTADGKILRRRDVLATALPPDFRIVTLAELVAAIGEA